ncbi:hypothetical protein IDSA_04125 [Pseudidiomarina salinarum]|uniref:Uncharacterized protein n=1 Tax=Pseudidiomarina salinarum TaxID=435908 RepID=A0A094LAM2_9GAMM|nr:hypothetical protein [Pseudidiomarina salinarum]KFZ31878.1 hypothetical protein IDSA_04125 [Pseudidiomarina salinarum]RUO70348.1 hypothetical protein CWI79_02460 [Pseudidiomarina salinarum]
MTIEELNEAQGDLETFFKMLTKVIATYRGERQYIRIDNANPDQLEITAFGMRLLLEPYLLIDKEKGDIRQAIFLKAQSGVDGDRLVRIATLYPKEKRKLIVPAIKQSNNPITVDMWGATFKGRWPTISGEVISAIVGLALTKREELH